MKDMVSSRKIRPLPLEAVFRGGSAESFVGEVEPVLISALVSDEFFLVGNGISLTGGSSALDSNHQPTVHSRNMQSP